MATERMAFKTEMQQMMDIIIHSLYSNPDIFLRELISNASDAIDKVRFEAITKPELLENDSDWKIEILADKEAGTLTIRDNGIGMNRDTIIEDLGTLARSGTKEFIAKLKEADAADHPELIGQFGLGFYSSFMVADKVSVHSRMAGDTAEGVRWESDGKGEFSIETVEKAGRGTDVILQLKEDAKDKLDEWSIRSTVKKFSDFVEHPIVMDVERSVPVEGEEPKEGEIPKTETRIETETLNAGQAIWLRSKSEIKQEEYHEFYKHISRDFEDPSKVVHFVAEGVTEFRALLFIPKRRPFDFLTPERKNGLQLYIKRVFIMDNCEELLPPYLRFVSGVVDASDLPLNVSREILQSNPLLETIKKNLISKVLAALSEMQKEEQEQYESFYEAFGAVLKEGIYLDWANKDKISELLRFQTAKTEAGKQLTLAQYVEAMPDDQKEIYYLIGESVDRLRVSPYLEALVDKGYDVLFMVDPVDEWVTGSLTEYQGKKLKAIDRGDIEAEADESKEAEEKEQGEQFKSLLGYLNSKIEQVKEVRLSKRLKDSASCLVSEDGKMGAYMENILKRLGRDGEMPSSERTLELNADHPVVVTLQNIYDADPSDPKVIDYGMLLYDQAVLAEGSKVEDPGAMARRINELIVQSSAK